MKFHVTVEMEDIGDHSWIPEVYKVFEQWLEKLVTDRMTGLKRASRATTKKSYRYKAMVTNVEVERAPSEPPPEFKSPFAFLASFPHVPGDIIEIVLRRGPDTADWTAQVLGSGSDPGTGATPEEALMAVFEEVE